MIFKSLTENSLKLISDKGSLDTIPNLSNFLKSGTLFQATILESFPDKNRALIKIFNKQIMVETKNHLTPGDTFSARVFKPSPELSLQIKIVSSHTTPPLSDLEDKAEISFKKLSSISTPSAIDKKIISDSSHRILDSNNTYIISELSARAIKSMNLSSGQVIKATVLDSQINNTVVKFENRLIRAYNFSVPPNVGENTSLIVTPYLDRFKLISLDDSAPKPIDILKIKSLLPYKKPFGEMIQKLDILLNSSETINSLRAETGLVSRLIKTLNLLKAPFFEQDLTSQGNTLVKQQIDLSGINYESKVKNAFEGKELLDVPANVKNDLKGQLLNLLKLLEIRIEGNETSAGQRYQLLKVIKVLMRAVDNIELQQLTNQLSRQENQPITLQIPDPFMIGKTINLYIRQTEDDSKNKENKESKSVLLVFFLELSALGNLRVDAKMNNQAISLRIDVENSNIAKFIENSLKDFCSSLEDLGFEVNASCCVVANIDKELDSKLNPMLISETDRLVDLRT
ncbi:MAG TPA: flagellar hook-length control protein FliK [Nitrospinaceae bacterium]|nr:flagellar hook-length control protein FliK [Nitrospinaceae bacterium]